MLLIWKICKKDLCTLEFPGVFFLVMIVLQSQNTHAGGTVCTDMLPRKVRISIDFSSSLVEYGSRNRRTVFLKSGHKVSCIHHHSDFSFFLFFFF